MISIVIPLYNKQDCIRKTIDSVLGQKDYDDYELVVVDDGSTDKSCEIVESYNDSRIHLYKKENGGPASARNYGVEKSQGEWIIFMDADDYFEADALATFHHLSEKHPEIGCFSANIFFDKNGKKKRYSWFMLNGTLRSPFRSLFLMGFMPRAGATMFRKSILEKYPFNANLRRYEDGEMIFAIMHNERFYNISKPVMSYNCDSLAASKPRPDIKEDYLGYLNLSGKGLWERIEHYDLYSKCMRLYPEDAMRLYGKDFIRKSDALPYLGAKLCRKMINVLNRILNKLLSQ